MAAPSEELDLTDLHHKVLDALAGAGAFFFRTLSDAVGSTDDHALTGVLWDLIWAVRISNDTVAPLRALLSGGRTAHKPRRTAPRSTRYSGGGGSLGALSGRRLATGRASMPSRTGPPTATGRWSLLPTIASDATVRSYAAAEVLLDRYGVVTRSSVVAEGVSGGFAGVYRVLAAAEESGRVRRGYFVEGLGAAQFATAGAVDRLRAQSRPLPDGPLFGGGHHDGAPSAVVLAASDPALLQSAADALALAVREGALGKLTVEKADGDPVLGSDHPLAAALAGAGFHATPRGLRLRR